ncbi:MAG: hypothetical protein ACM31D_07820 [Bacteroidota bacterium]
MALGANKVSAFASPGMAAAATARPVSGGRNVASTGRGVVGTDFSPQIEINDNRLWRFDEEREFEQDREDSQKEQATPFIARAYNGFKVDEAEEGTDAGTTGKVFLDAMIRGISIYETNIRLTTPGAVRPGSVLNYRL